MHVMAASGSVVVVGGGIIGASIAYQLTLRGVTVVTLIERCEVAAAASGKAGGFLARGWGDGSSTEQLHHVSFDMHEKLAQTLGVNSYRKLPTMQVAGGKRRSDNAVPWLDGAVRSCEVMDEETAQVTPKELTEKLVEAAVRNGAQLLVGKTEGVQTEAEGSCTRVTAVVVDGQPVAAERFVFCLGPWTGLLEDWLPGQVQPMQGVKSTSVVFQHEAGSVAPFALFCGEDRNGCHLEVYPRPNGEVYMCGIGGSKYLEKADIVSLAPEDVASDPKRVAAAKASFSALSSLGAPEVARHQACMRPCPPDGLPYMGALPATENAFIAAGHNCWGILWAPATGLALAELLTDGKSDSIDLGAFDPARFGGGGMKAHKRSKGAGREHVG